MNSSDLKSTLEGLITKHSLSEVIGALLEACDELADKCAIKNDKKGEQYWRKNSSNIFDYLKKDCINFTKTTRRTLF